VSQITSFFLFFLFSFPWHNCFLSERSIQLNVLGSFF
jgi:hypothetical protein